MGENYDDRRKKTKITKIIPFNSERKRMSTIVEEDGRSLIFLKGASEIVLASCDQWMNCNTGAIQNITGTELNEMKEAIVSMAKKSLRTLCFAYKELNSDDDFGESDQNGIYEV